MDDAGFGDDDYRELLALRNELRRFLHRSELEAKAVGLTDAQHHLLLAIRGHADAAGPSIRDLADQLQLRHHSTVELVQRAELAGLVTRHEDREDRRVVRLALSRAGRTALDRLAVLHAEERDRLASMGTALTRAITPAPATGSVPVPAARPARRKPARAPARPKPAASRDAGAPRPATPPGQPAPPAPAAPARTAGATQVRSVYDRPAATAGWRVLVDRQWPRGLRAEDAPFDEWLSPVAPSSGLRRAFEREPGRFEELAESYRGELRAAHAEELDRLAKVASQGPLLLLTAAPEPARSSAAVLAEEVRARG